MTDLLYAYKATDDDGEELRYSLRSIEANLHMPDLSVTIAGDLPSWVSGVRHVRGNPYEDKPRNMLFNVVEACGVLWSDHVDNCIYLSDDYLLMYPQEDVMPLATGSLEEYVHSHYIRTKRKTDWYRIAIEETFRLLRRDEVSNPLVFDLHHPLPLNTGDAVRALSPYLNAHGPYPFWRTMYGNIVGWNRPVHITQDGLYYGQSPMRIGTPWVSAIPSQWDGMMRSRAKRLFPTPSRWERTT